MSGGKGPHDALFRRILGEPANAASQLRAVLPERLVKRLAWDRLTPVPGSFVDAELQWRHSDLLFACPLAGRKAFIYVLVEHQSSTDVLMPFRIMHYVVRIWDRYLAEHPQATRLPAVIPLVVHHHRRRRWEGPTDVWELVDLDADLAQELGEHLPRLRFVLDDLAMVDERALRARAVTPPVRMTLLLLKIAAGNPRLASDLGGWVDELHAVLARPTGREDLITILKYIENVGEAPAGELRELFARLGSQAEEVYVTTAEQLRAEGRAQGRAQVLVQQLTLKFGPLPPAVRQAVDAATAEQLETWTTRVLTADTLADVLTDRAGGTD